VIGPDGRVHQRTAVSEQRVLHDTVGLRRGTTIYTRWGLAPALAVAVAGLAVGWLVSRPRRREGEPDVGDAERALEPTQSAI
jgi:apolipoprotein N-acyltransferase